MYVTMIFTHTHAKAHMHNLKQLLRVSDDFLKYKMKKGKKRKKRDAADCTNTHMQYAHRYAHTSKAGWDSMTLES